MVHPIITDKALKRGLYFLGIKFDTEITFGAKVDFS